MHSATRRLSSRFFIGGPSLSLGRKWSSGKNGCSHFLKYTPRGILSPFFKKIEKKKKEKTDGSLTVADNPLTNRLKLTILQIEKVLTSNVWSASRF